MAFSGASADANADLFRPLGDLVEDSDGVFQSNGDEQLDAISVIPNSMCMACGETGDTRMLTTKIPFFREIIVCSFECDSCGDTNNEVTFGGEIQEKGIRYELLVKDKSDLDRSVIKADTATVLIPSLELEIPARSQKGGITTVEGLLSTAAKNLGIYQRERMKENPEVGLAVGRVIMGLHELADGETFPFSLSVDDPSGNSFVENRLAPAKDPQLRVTHYDRTPGQDLAIGLQPSAEARAAGEEGKFDPSNKAHGAVKASQFDGAQALMGRFGYTPTSEEGEQGEEAKEEEEKKQGEAEGAAGKTPLPEGTAGGEEGRGGTSGGCGCGGASEAEGTAAAAAAATGDSAVSVGESLGGYFPDGSADLNEDVSTALGRREIIRFPAPCPNCLKEGEEDTCIADIPHFKEIIIMAFNCAFCGYRTNEVKGGGGIPAKGQIFTVRCEGPDDLARDVLKASSADVVLPELDFEASQASLGGVFTTVEGLLTKVHQTMLDSSPYMMGDSAQDSDRKSAYKAFSDQLGACAAGQKFPFTLTLRDPLANSFIGTRGDTHPDDDPRLKVEDYTRSFDEDEELGIHDMNVGDDYATFGDGGGGGGGGGSDGTASAAAAAGAEAVNENRALTHKRWGPDHPHEFAKGCEDDLKPTPLGSEGDSGGWQTAAAGAPPPAAAPAGAAAAAAAAASPPSSAWSGPVGSLAAAADSGVSSTPSGGNDFGGVDAGAALKLAAALAARIEEEEEEEGEEEVEYGQGEGWCGPMSTRPSKGTARTLNPAPAASVHDDPRDLSLEFEASPSFAGARSGFVFRTGARGLGYYADARAL